MKQEFKILLLEAVDCSSDLLEYELSKTSTRFTLARVENQESYLLALVEFCPHLILADCRLRHFDGLMAMAQAQEICPEIPFLFVSAEMSPAPQKLEAAAVIHQKPLMRVRPKVKTFFPETVQEPKTC